MTHRYVQLPKSTIRGGRSILKALHNLILLCIITGRLIVPCFGHVEASNWAISSLEEARTLDIIPDNLDQDYQQPITRAEFAQVAMYFCAAQYNVSINVSIFGVFCGRVGER